MTTDLNTAFRHHPLFICGAAATILSPQSTNFGQQKTSGKRFLPLPKCRRDTESAPVWLHVPKYERPGCRRCSASQGGREAWKAWISRIFFCLSYMFSLRQVGKKTDISVPCPMSRSAKQDLPFVRQLSVVFLSANEFWKSENSREKVHTRCALGFMSVLYTLFMKVASLCLTSGSQEMVDH